MKKMLFSIALVSFVVSFCATPVMSLGYMDDWDKIHRVVMPFIPTSQMDNYKEKLISYPCDGSAEYKGICDDLDYQDYQRFKFEIPGNSLIYFDKECEYDYDGECRKQTYYQQGGTCGESVPVYDSDCYDVFLVLDDFSGYVPAYFCYLPSTISGTCAQCYSGEWGENYYAHATTCDVKLYYKTYETCDEMCKDIDPHMVAYQVSYSDKTFDERFCNCECTGNYEIKSIYINVTTEYGTEIKPMMGCMPKGAQQNQGASTGSLTTTTDSTTESTVQGVVEDTCENGVQDIGEDNVDCGGICPPCNYVVTLTPSSTEIYADGVSTQSFTLKALYRGKPASGLTYTVSSEFSLRSISGSAGRLSASSITTGADGTASFTYTAPSTPAKYFDGVEVRISVSGPSGQRTHVTLKDPKPKVSVTLSERSMLEGNAMNYADVIIEDGDSTKWDVKVDASLGKLMAGGRSGEYFTLLDSTNEKKYSFIWKRPPSAVELIESFTVYAQDHKNDWSGYKNGLKSVTVDALLKTQGPTGEAAAEIKSWKDQYDSWNGNVAEMTRDIDRIKTSTTTFERFLRSISLGVEGLQTFYGTKGFIKDKFEDSGDSGFVSFIKAVRDKTIDYGCDSLQNGLRLWASLVREGSLDTITVPVKIIVQVTDGEGNVGKKTIVFRYTYHLGPGD